MSKTKIKLPKIVTQEDLAKPDVTVDHFIKFCQQIPAKNWIVDELWKADDDANRCVMGHICFDDRLNINMTIRQNLTNLLPNRALSLIINANNKRDIHDNEPIEPKEKRSKGIKTRVINFFKDIKAKKSISTENNSSPSGGTQPAI